SRIEEWEEAARGPALVAYSAQETLCATTNTAFNARRIGEHPAGLHVSSVYARLVTLADL
ncbi:MAG: hypothetical protein LC740_02260, partial [Actinobacteria bacterium]|nr:hypothetical protein [Actinomycetota bacterium]